ncbi:MAG: ribose-5-phosphate isomerase RpiA [Myxococcota bacterium]
MSQDDLKAQAAAEAVTHITSGTTIGLGTGSTMAFALDGIARRIRDEGLEIRGVPTSRTTEMRARELGIPLTTLREVPRLALAIDGADEVDGNLAMIKGGGGALLREKIVARVADRVIIMVHEAKQVRQLGAFPLPIEVVPFGATPLLEWLRDKGFEARIRAHDDVTFVTDEGHWIVDAKASGPILDPADLHRRLLDHPAVVETGLFVGLCDLLVVASSDGVKTVTA